MKVNQEGDVEFSRLCVLVLDYHDCTTTHANRIRPVPNERPSHLYLDARLVRTPPTSGTTIDLREYQQQLIDRDQEIHRLNGVIAEQRYVGRLNRQKLIPSNFSGQENLLETTIQGMADRTRICL